MAACEEFVTKDVTWGLGGIGSSCPPPVCCPVWCWGNGGQTRAAGLCSESWGTHPPEGKTKTKQGHSGSYWGSKSTFLPSFNTHFLQHQYTSTSCTFSLCSPTVSWHPPPLTHLICSVLFWCLKFIKDGECWASMNSFGWQRKQQKCCLEILEGDEQGKAENTSMSICKRCYRRVLTQQL